MENVDSTGSPTVDDLGQATDEALIARMMEPEQEAAPQPVPEPEPDPEPAEASDTTPAEDVEDAEYEEVEEEVFAESDQDDSEEPELFSVKVDGEEQSVTLDELRRGYSGQTFINQQMQKVAEQRKEAEQIFGALAQERAQVQQALQMLQDGTFAAPPVAPDEALFETDPLAFMEARLAYDKQAAEYQERLGQLQNQVSAHTQTQQQARQVYLAREAEMLQGFAPELFDENQGETNRKALVDSAVESYGFTPEEMGMVLDHRHVLVLRDALAYRALNSESGKKQVEKKVQTKQVRSSKRKVNAEQQRQKRLRQKLKETGNIEDALSLLDS
jgi:hypothetical protein